MTLCLHASSDGSRQLCVAPPQQQKKGLLDNPYELSVKGCQWANVKR